jgi:hypothetical protein
MPKLFPLRWLVVAVSASVIGISACGSSSKTSSPPGSSTSSIPSSSKQDIAADTAAAQAAKLKLSDFPPGWTSAPPSNTTGSQSVTGQLAKCLGVTEANLSKPPAKALSDDFSQSNMTASSTVGYRATSAEQTAAFNLWASPKTPSCMTTAVSATIEEAIKHPTTGSTLPAGVKFGQSAFQTMSFPTYGDKTIAYQLKVPVDYKGLSLAFYEDAIVVIKGRADVVMSFENSPTDPFPTDQEQHYTGLVVGRLTNT